MDAVALRIREIDPQARVACAFLELTKPDLLEAVANVVADGATRVTVLPMFLGVGRHARDDPEFAQAGVAHDMLAAGSANVMLAASPATALVKRSRAPARLAPRSKMPPRSIRSRDASTYSPSGT